MRTDEELWEALLRVDDGPYPEVTSEDVDAELRAMGIDPVALVLRMDTERRKERAPMEEQERGTTGTAVYAGIQVPEMLCEECNEHILEDVHDCCEGSEEIAIARGNLLESMWLEAVKEAKRVPVDTTVRYSCGDSGCLSPEREYGGMKTNGGCRCEREEVARAHERMAARIRNDPSYHQPGKSYMTGREVARNVIDLLRREAAKMSIEETAAGVAVLRVAEHVEKAGWGT